ncbi:ribosome silencing factor [Spirulina sp. CS-785/01]|uniref:ribosome silencing factor n=1 Tax=Spirulina sp. CS-785/01 TaxID=3021716 RepID=UPI00232FC3DC|nr:ribosome silencing factor [Spirulina sp. CS-785/01]MDB9313252.1 ribosome silencing factor [Spirulina sp. CS-785/01]
MTLENRHPNSIPSHQTEEESLALAWAIAEAGDDRKAENIVLLGVEEVCYLTDYFVIMTGYSTTQVRAIGTAIQNKLEADFQRSPQRVEGKSEGTWMLLDYGDAIAHILLPEERDFYNLEAFWGHAQRIEFHSPSPASSQIIRE